jgi:hypothetical protein
LKAGFRRKGVKKRGLGLTSLEECVKKDKSLH